MRAALAFAWAVIAVLWTAVAVRNGDDVLAWIAAVGFWIAAACSAVAAKLGREP